MSDISARDVIRGAWWAALVALPAAVLAAVAWMERPRLLPRDRKQAMAGAVLKVIATVRKRLEEEIPG